MRRLAALLALCCAAALCLSAMADGNVTVIRFDPENKPGVSNLLSIMSALGGGDIETICDELQGQGYGVLKSRVADCVIAALEPLQAEFRRLMADKAYPQGVIDEGAANANRIALRTLRKVQKNIGFAPKGNA